MFNTSNYIIQNKYDKKVVSIKLYSCKIPLPETHTQINGDFTLLSISKLTFHSITIISNIPPPRYVILLSVHA